MKNRNRVEEVMNSRRTMVFLVIIIAVLINIIALKHIRLDIEEKNLVAFNDEFVSASELKLIQDDVNRLAPMLQRSVIGIRSYPEKDEGRGVYYTGSGVIFHRVGSTYYALTNQHVIDDARYLRIYLSDEVVLGEVVIFDYPNDLAVVSFKTDNYYPIVKFGKLSDISVGDFVIAVGNPTDIRLKGTLTYGMVSDKNDLITGYEGSEGRNYASIRHSAQISGGSSGGGLFNLKGELIGINSSGIPDTFISNAIRIDVVEAFVERFKAMML